LRSDKNRISWEEASRLPLCLLAPEMQHRGSLPPGLFGQVSTSLPHVETNSISALYSQVRTGAWSSVLPQSLAHAVDTNDDFDAVALPKSGKPIRVGVIMPDREFSLPLAEAFFRIALNANIASTRRKSK